MAHQLTFECHPCGRWTNLRRTGEVWFADYCKDCGKTRRSIGCVEVPDPPSDADLRALALSDEARF